MILGHLPATYILYDQAFKDKLNHEGFSLFLLVLVCAYFPDLLDKSLNLLFRFSGRGIFHSLIVLNLFFSLPLIIFERSLGMFFLTSVTLHVLLDCHNFKKMLYPFFGFKFPGLEERFRFRKTTYSFYIERNAPKTLSMEMILTIFAIIIAVNQHFYRMF